MNQINTTLFVQDPLPTLNGRSNSEFLRLVNQSRPLHHTAPVTEKPVLRMRWIYGNHETSHPILRASWQVVAQP